LPSQPEASAVNVEPLKAFAREYLSQTSNLRAMILADVDTMPRSEAIVKFEMYNRMLDLELKH
jgi:hypothetical protein